jgi:hypothetical protein
MHRRHFLFVAVFTVVWSLGLPVVSDGVGGMGVHEARAQTTTFSDAQRRCHTIITCRFKKGGAYRGCLSSYSCRRCRLVRANCKIGRNRGGCRRLRCEWAGS